MSDLPARVKPRPLDTPFAEVAVDVLNVPADKTYHYAIPAHLRDRVAPGVMVLVGFGDRIIEGLVAAGSESSPVADVREILDVVADGALLTPAQIDLARRISRYYCASPMKTILPMLPPGLRGRVQRWSRLDPLVELPEDVATTRGEQRFMAALRSETEVAHEHLRELAGPTVFKRMQRKLERSGAVHLRAALRPAAPPPLREQWVESRSSAKEAEPLLRRSRVQRRLLQALDRSGGGAVVGALLAEVETTAAPLRALVEKELVRITPRRSGHTTDATVRELPRPQAPQAQEALESIETFMSTSGADSGCRTLVVMADGDTGPQSSNTALYVHAIAQARDGGAQALVLAPNAHAARRLAGDLEDYFPGSVALWHGTLSPAQRRPVWERVRRGEPVVVVGARSAVFLPYQSLGVVVVDSEHEDSYKNQESPRFHAVTAAEWLAERFAAPLLLFSHTPRITTYAKVEESQASFTRATDVIPTATVIDMRVARHVGPRQLVSRELRDAIAHSLAESRPVVLMQNRRGAATHAFCPECGHVVECRNCSVPLVQHRASGVMRCHRCGSETPIPTQCALCESDLRFRGVGSQTVELEMRRLFPKARIARWDRDVISAKEEPSPFAALRNGALDILIGTAAVLVESLPVGLYAVVSADTALHLPDYRASERSYQLLRRIGFLAARCHANVLVQTYTPESLPVRAMQVGRYLWFYCKSIAERSGVFPPSIALAVMLYQHRDADRAVAAAVALVQCLQEIAARDGLEVELLGPAPAFPERVRSLYRWHVMVRGKDIHELLPHVPQGWLVDVDPVSVL